MKVSRRQVMVGGSACVVLPLTACVARQGSTLHESAVPSARATSSAPPNTTPSPQTTALSSRDSAPSLPSHADAETSHQHPKPVATALSCERLVAKIGRNHGHDFPIAARDVLDATTKSFDLRGQSDHTHAIELSADELAALGRGEVVRKQSERGGGNAHRHRVMLRCEPLVLPPEMTSACEIVVAGKDDHELVIPESHVSEGRERQYDIQGVAGHTHVLTITSEDFAQIASGTNVDLVSARGLGHFHHVYIRYPVRPTTRG